MLTVSLAWIAPTKHINPNPKFVSLFKVFKTSLDFFDATNLIDLYIANQFKINLLAITFYHDTLHSIDICNERFTYTALKL